MNRFMDRLFGKGSGNDQSSGAQPEDRALERAKGMYETRGQLKIKFQSILASKYHDIWRSERKLKGRDGYEPRMKSQVVNIQTGKSSWVNQSEVSTKYAGPEWKVVKEQDIANTDFANLDQYWQKENWEAAGAVLDILLEVLLAPESKKRKTCVELMRDKAFLIQAATKVHQMWQLRRKIDGWIDPKLNVDFDQLPKDEQEKDMDQVLVGLKLLSGAQY